MGFDQIYWAEVLGELGPLGTEFLGHSEFQQINILPIFSSLWL